MQPVPADRARSLGVGNFPGAIETKTAITPPDRSQARDPPRRREERQVSRRTRSQPVDHTPEAVLAQRVVPVHDEAQSMSREFQVRQQLGFVNGRCTLSMASTISSAICSISSFVLFIGCSIRALRVFAVRAHFGRRARGEHAVRVLRVFPSSFSFGLPFALFASSR